MISHPEPPEFHTQPSTPLSPLPLHPPEPSKIPVLQHQIDPIFNMTTTHEPLTEAPAAESKVTDSGDSSPSHDSSFSDAYKENPEEEKKDDVVVAAPQESGAEVDDDYGMTLDSEDEEQSDYHDVSESHVEQDTASLPVTVPAAAIPSPPISHNSKTSETPHNGPDNKPTQSKFSPSHATPTPASATPSENHAAQLPVQALQSQPHKYEDIANGGIDIQQLLDNITANAENNAAASGLTPTTPSVVSSLASLPFGSSNPPNLPSHASLPPRPQVSSYRPASLVAAGAPGTSSDPRNGLPPPPTASFHTPPQPMPTHTQQGAYQTHSTAALVSPNLNDDADKKWTPKTQKIYDDFLEQERQYVAEGLWDRFPLGSRLFIGNLSSENVTKRDIFHVFHRYGRLAQVSIKQAYGFVQFHDSPACKAALETEQGREIRGKKIHLEISKPQKNTRNAQKATPQQQVRRSRSPEHQRGGMSERGGRSNQSGGRNGDHYDNRSGQSGRDEYGRTMRPRDDYRSGRSPSPPRGNYRGRDDFGSNRGRDYYDGRRRSRSNSPYSQRDNGRYRERSLSPGARQAAEDADLQIPRRNPRDVPDVQIILLDELDRGFVSWVDGQFRDRGLKSEIMFLSPRLPVQAVIRRQILEGVHAVCKLDIRSQNSSKIPLQVFDRQAGANNVRFDEYEDLEPRLAAELVLRTKAQSQIPIYTQPQPQPQYPSGQSYQPYQPQVAPAPAPVPVQDLASLVGQLDNATLQRLLSALPPQQQNAPAVAANSTIDLAGLLGGLQTHPPPATPQPTYHQQTAPAPAPAPYNPGPASFQPQQQPQSAQQVQNIMAQLAKFRQ